MKALVVDDDGTARMLISRILSNFSIEVIEAEDGVDGLVALEEHDPDLMILDLNMPNIDGFEVLEAIRRSPAHHGMPVVCMSSSAERASVNRLMDLGIADYLIKPVRRNETLARLRDVVEIAARWKEKQRQQGLARAQNRRLLIVDPSSNFREFAAPLLDGYQVTHTAYAGEGLKLCEKTHPAMVLCSDGLPLLNETKFAALVYQAAQIAETAPPLIYLTTNDESTPPEKAASFSGVIRKSFVPQVFLQNFKATVAGKGAFELFQAAAAGLSEELVSATAQTIGVMTGQNARQAEPDEGSFQGAVRATVELRSPVDGCALAVDLVCSKDHTEELAEHLLRRPVKVGEGAEEALGELVNTIAGRLRTALGDRGFELRIGIPETVVLASEDRDSSEWDLAMDFATGESQRFRVAVRAHEPDPGDAAGSPAVAAAPTGGDHVTASAAGGTGDDELADILF